MYKGSTLKTLRQRRGLEPDDSSEDEAIQAMSPREAFEECCGWTIGDPGWASEILQWLEECGYIVTEKS